MRKVAQSLCSGCLKFVLAIGERMWSNAIVGGALCLAATGEITMQMRCGCIVHEKTKVDKTDCKIHTKRRYQAEECKDYIPCREPKSPTDWPKCVCGRLARDHN